MAVNRPEDLALLAQQMAGDTDHAAVLSRVVAAAMREVTGAELAGVTIVDRRSGASTPASTDPLVQQVDALQYAYREGPCLDAARTNTVIRCDDLAAEARWPRFGPAAARLGQRSMMSFPLFVQDTRIGALNLYAAAPHAFTADAQDIGELLAAHAAVALLGAAQQANLRTALASRDVIGQAKGILMERLTITAEQAFDVLLAASSRTNIKLADVARHLVATGELAQPIPRPRAGEVAAPATPTPERPGTRSRRPGSG